MSFAKPIPPARYRIVVMSPRTTKWRFTFDYTNKRSAQRHMRQFLRAKWPLLRSCRLLRGSVYDARGLLIDQARIDTASAANGWKRMIVEEEL